MRKTTLFAVGLVLTLSIVILEPPTQARDPFPPDPRFARWDKKASIPPEALQVRLIGVRGFAYGVAKPFQNLAAVRA